MIGSSVSPPEQNRRGGETCVFLRVRGGSAASPACSLSCCRWSRPAWTSNHRATTRPQRRSWLGSLKAASGSGSATSSPASPSYFSTSRSSRGSAKGSGRRKAHRQSGHESHGPAPSCLLPRERRPDRSSSAQLSWEAVCLPMPLHSGRRAASMRMSYPAHWAAS